MVSNRPGHAKRMKLGFASLGIVLGLIAALLLPAGAMAQAPSQAQAIQAINKSFNSVKTMRGEFIQFGPTGGRVEGQFFIHRPGKLRFYYNKPSSLDIIADGDMISIKDRKLQTQDIWPLSQTPLRFLLADKIDLTRDANVTAINVEEDLVSVQIDDKTRFASGRLTLIFDTKDFKLKQWTVRDNQGYDTSVAIYNVEENGPTNPELFEIDYLANARQNRRNN
ncbi:MULTISPECIES: LolA family protein [Pseudovibrio]|uniref:LolA family protein n=1 Tax=Stappiaceae TaxID=2821832 RepID=UPI002366B19D|nr:MULTISPECIES: outer membrane lipoprotein carrier protein LolA [Pseudovibrio]MDD7909463.1 outer membrane lipoprotein carrier protein LolA [Pseudovibrio exalbescens]MDX5595023.1 outer membrane lipoprotein carrier protein LolA [Pseudovibrio sp. SPO723]